MTPVQLHDIALTLENDGKFYREYRAFCNDGGSDSQLPKTRRNRINQACKRLGLQSTKRSDREQLRRYLDDIWNTDAVDDWEGDDPHIDDADVEFWLESVKYPTDLGPFKARVKKIVDDVDALCSTPTTPKEKVMNSTAIVVTSQVLLNGKPVDSLDDSTIFDVIRTQESEIEALKGIKAQPKRLVAEINKRQAGIDALVAYLDAKGGTAPVVAAVPAV